MIKIEKATVADAAELCAIYAPYVLNTAVSFEYTVPDEKEFAKRIEDISAKYPYLKAVDENGSIVGYAYANTFKSRIAYSWAVETTIYLKSEARRKGTGKALYVALENSLKKMGIVMMNACIASCEKEDERINNDSMHFHEKMGFKLVGRFDKIGHKFDSWYDMIWMQKQISKLKPAAELPDFGKWEI